MKLRLITFITITLSAALAMAGVDEAVQTSFIPTASDAGLQIGVQQPSIAETTEAIRNRTLMQIPRDGVDPRFFECHYCTAAPGSAIRTQTVATSDGSTQISIITTEEANALMQEMRTGELGREIDFNFIQDGCYARAHALSERLRQRGIFTAKVFASGFSGANYTYRGQIRTYSWKYHVAPVVYVREGHQLRMMVLDPTLFNQTASVGDWLNKQATAAPHTYGNVFLATTDVLVPTASYTEPNLTPYSEAFNNHRTEYGLDRFRNPTIEEIKKKSDLNP